MANALVMNDANMHLERTQIANELKTLLLNFDNSMNDISYKRGFYIYGSPGSGKTKFVLDAIREIGYDVIKYDAGDVRNKNLIDTITSSNIASQNVLQMMEKKKKRIVILMDEIDGMNNGDKGGINALIKLIRQKKTKKQKLESCTKNPIICVGNYSIDKKLKELMKVCNTFELKLPTQNQIHTLFTHNIQPYNHINQREQQVILNYIQGDLRKLEFVTKLLLNKPGLINMDKLNIIFKRKSVNEDAKKTTQQLINNQYKLEDHARIMNETDRTIISLLWHENIVDVLEQQPKERSFPLYLQLLNNICYADYIDRITFQSQIWQFNEMSSLIKTFYNNKLYHEYFDKKPKFNPVEVRFTKVLTKYSTEYNNMMFLINLCQNLDLDKKDVLAMFQELRIFKGNDFYEKNEILNSVEKMFQDTNITKLDIKRMYRFLDKNVKKDALVDELDE
jgi:DNA polymerase III delta prime subunit|uniref:AAA+ ATPase domain-containing protein n=1 Tax=viral metagenome TaxID=1070528 RepID=A0A6C0IRJ4_9ZZZZ